jgi:signal transduction histidine kinase
VSPELIGAKMRRISVADMRAFSSLAWVAMLRRLSVVFMIGAMLPRPCAAADAGESVVRLFSQEMRQIEANSVELQSQLSSLPPAPVPQATARLGWHSIYRTSDAKAEWVELNLGEAQVLDAVVLIAPPPNGGTVDAGYGFPRRFYVEIIGEGEETGRTILAEHTEAEFPNPGTLPVVLPAGGRLTQKVRITATRLFGEKERYFFALGEVMLLQGKENLGARIERIGPEQVIASSSQGTRPDWGRINLVDGHNALGPPLGTQRSPTLGFHSGRISEPLRTDSPWVELDLGHATLVDEVRLFPAHPPNFAHTQGYGFPVRYQIELREEENATPVVLPAPQSGSYAALPGDNVIAIPGGHHARHVRLTAVEPHVTNGSAILALAEMQVWSGGENAALGKAVSAFDSTESGGWSKAALVDGFTSIANILDWPEWLAGLSKRREVLQQIATIEARQRQLVQQWQRYGLGALTMLVVASIAATIAWSMRQRRARLREMEVLRQRIARDLHDEIGSSLGSIALIAQDIRVDDPQARDDLAEIKTIADESVAAMRDITRLIQSDRYGSDDLATLLRETAARLLRTIPHTLTVEAGTSSRKLPVDRQRDLILILKEALHNITRHAEATAVGIKLKQTADSLVLTLQDDGKGFDPAAVTGGMGLTNLRRRAEKHQGRVDIVSTPQGTTLTLTLPFHA